MQPNNFNKLHAMWKYKALLNLLIWKSPNRSMSGACVKASRSNGARS